MKVENYLKIKKVGINAIERKFLREQIRNFELDLLMLLDEAVF